MSRWNGKQYDFSGVAGSVYDPLVSGLYTLATEDKYTKATEDTYTKATEAEIIGK